MPPEVRERHALVNKIFVSINILVSVCAGVAYWLGEYGLLFQRIYLFCKISVGFLNVIAAGFLVVGIYNIR